MEKQNEKCCTGDGEVAEDSLVKVGSLDPTSIEQMAAIFKALGDDRRLELVRMIADEPGICACVLLKSAQFSQPTLSHHMRILMQSGIVEGYRQGKWMHYKINKVGLAAIYAFTRSLLPDELPKK